MKLFEKKILIYRLSSIGDVALTTVLIRVLRTEFPNALINFVVAEPFKQVIENNLHINNIFVYNKSFNQDSIDSLKKQILASSSGKYDIVIDLQKNIRSYRFLSNLGTNTTRMNKRRLHKLCLVYCKKSPFISLPVPELYISSAELNLKPDGLGLEIWTKKDKEDGIYYPHSKDNSIYSNLYAIAPGAKHFTKRYPKEKFAEFVSILQQNEKADIVFLGGKEDFDLSQSIIDLAGIKAVNLCGAKTITETAEVLDTCKALITNDTGVMHIAAARKTPAVAIFGSTVTDFGFAPYLAPHIIVQKDLDCRPCTHIGRASCPKNHFDCMNSIEPNQIYNSLKMLLNSFNK